MTRRRLIVVIATAIIGAIAALVIAYTLAPEPAPPAAHVQVNGADEQEMSESTYCWKAWNGGLCADTFGLSCSGSHSAEKVEASKGDKLHFRLGFTPESRPLLHVSELDPKGRSLHPSLVEKELVKSRTPTWTLTQAPPVHLDISASAGEGRDASYEVCLVAP